ncbi:MAG: B12-binding domain-containing radical SAM protein [candidate division KSB1 bacterium]|nr:B12-binding domain-containing radical SAM protein [candidate division KSB1 bacterium]
MSNNSINYKHVLLVNPAIDKEKKYGKLVNMLLTPSVPLSIVFLGTFLEHQGYQVRLFDEQIEWLSADRLQEVVNEFHPGVIGFTCTTPGMARAHEIARDIKQLNPNIKVVMGNIHPTVLPEETLKNDHVDLVVRGEGEFTFLEYLRSLANGGNLDKVDGISFRVNGGYQHNKDRAYEKDLDVFPPVNWNLLTDTKGNYSIEWILTSRGCPYKCVFCSARSVSGFRYRFNSPQRAIHEVDVVVQKYGKKFFSFADDNFVVKKDRAREICRLLIERGYHKHVKWLCQTRADAVDKPLLELMREAGCEYISFGIETGTQRLLDLIGKSLKIETVEKAVTMAHEVGIKTRGSFMLGLPTETREDSLATINFALKLPLDIAKFNLAVPYPGTELLNMAIAEGLRVTGDWSNINTAAGLSNTEAFYIPKGRTMEELAKLQKMAHTKFYLRPRQIWRILKRENIDFNLPEIKSPRQFFQLIGAIIEFLIQTIRK